MIDFLKFCLSNPNVNIAFCSAYNNEENTGAQCTANLLNFIGELFNMPIRFRKSFEDKSCENLTGEHLIYRAENVFNQNVQIISILIMFHFVGLNS